ncbi:MAG: hypothetical protein H6818_13655 [Phycisphaerales bacterium]|nr:hypothetical protein [Phycisphaerales bacterium]MCB9862152.1 hypothetical protein [Phycisphaerales bacterium]
MHRKIILVVATLSVAIGAYFLFSRDDDPVAKRESSGAEDAARTLKFVERSGESNKTMSAGPVDFSPGKHPRIVIHDQKSGKPQTIFEADEWEPLSDDRFDVRNMRIQRFMADGEIVYISADRADVTVFHAGDNRFDPRRGKLTGNVRVVVDRTSEAWRLEHPELAEREQHPEELVHVEMESAQFDLDRSELIALGAVMVDSREARIEDVSDLTVRWDQTDNRLESLQFARGGKMIIRRGAGVVDFSLPGVEQNVSESSTSADGQQGSRVSVAANQPIKIDRARIDAPVQVGAVSAKDAAQQIRSQGLRVRTNQAVSLSVAKKLDNAPTQDAPSIARSDATDDSPEAAESKSAVPDTLRTEDALASDVDSIRKEIQTVADVDVSKMTTEELLAYRKSRVNSYRAMFQGSVVVEQRQGEQTVGSLRSDRLEAHFDFGKKLEDRMRTPVAKSDNEKADKTAEDAPEDDGQIVLIWNGPFDLHPLQIDPKQQTGKRFDVVAVGKPVIVTSRQGAAECRQLVFRNETEQVWLSGDGKDDVVLNVQQGRKLVGREIYFDKHRGLAHVEGAGYMQDKKSLEGKEALAAAFSNEASSVEIYWDQSVDVELGLKLVSSRNEATGQLEQKNDPYLRRAWFHGDVRFRRGDEMARADNVAATFGPPVTKGAVADFIEHLDLAGSVIVANHQHQILAEDLNVDLVRTADGRNVPRSVHASGRVTARQVRGEGRFIDTQLRREISADTMDVTMRELTSNVATNASDKPGALGSNVGMERLDARGNVEVRDPDHNLKISRTESMLATFNNGDQLDNLILVSPSPDVLAQARVEDMAVHGHRIELNMAEQSLDVPGPGKAWMVSRQDFGGRTLPKPQPVRADWRDQLQLRLNKDYGVFVGDVHISTEGFEMGCDKLTIRFASMPAIPNTADTKKAGRFGILGEILNDKPQMEWTDRIATSSERKRPTYVVAEGRAYAVSKTFAPGPNDDTWGRLLSRFRIEGAQIEADLEREQMRVPSAGLLMIEDYQFDNDSRRPTAVATRGVGGPLMSSVRSEGPSQTLVTWESKMDFFRDQGAVIFERDVKMGHYSGQQMALDDSDFAPTGFLAGLKDRLKPGRRAWLECQNLRLDFESDQRAVQKHASADSRATDLSSIRAEGAVLLVDGEWQLLGNRLQYSRRTEDVRIDGGNGISASITRQSAESPLEWRGDSIYWNRKTNKIEAPNARVTSH